MADIARLTTDIGDATTEHDNEERGSEFSAAVRGMGYSPIRPAANIPEAEWTDRYRPGVRLPSWPTTVRRSPIW